MAIEAHFSDEVPEDMIFRKGLLVASFLFGAFLCGLLVSRNELHFGKSMFGVVLVLNSMLLLGAVAVVDVPNEDSVPSHLEAKYIACYMMAAACGLQNAMCTTLFGAVMRTTHLTGLMTDCGLTLGRMASILLRARCQRRNFGNMDNAELAVDAKRLLVFACPFSGYLSGVMVGASVADAVGIQALFLPASLTGIGGLVYMIAKSRFATAFERAQEEEQAQQITEAEQIVEQTKKRITQIHVSNLQDDTEMHKALAVLHEMEDSLFEKIAGQSRASLALASDEDFMNTAPCPPPRKSARVSSIEKNGKAST